MRIYIVEDDENIIRILEKIIIDKNLGSVVGKATDGNLGLGDIETMDPDIVLVDLLMPGLDGISLVKEAKKTRPHTQFIMISQVSSKEMVAKAYKSGIEYYISKPIDAIEVRSVIEKVAEKVDMNKKLAHIESLFTKSYQQDLEKTENEDPIEGIKRVMQRIGIIGEVGSQDIIDIGKYILERDESMSDYTVKEICSKFTDNPKTMEQRIRRTATVGMINLANIGVEDHMNEIFTEYSNGLYNFDQLKVEMDYIRGKTSRRGKVNIKKFLEAIIYYGKRTL